MPITQDRFLALLTEAKAWQKAFNELRANVRWHVENQEAAGRDDPATIAAILQETHLVERPSDTRITLETEHFKRNKARNIKMQQRMAKIRAKAGAGAGRE
jgi:hypothetical protein